MRSPIPSRSLTIGAVELAALGQQDLAFAGIGLLAAGVGRCANLQEPVACKLLPLIEEVRIGMAELAIVLAVVAILVAGVALYLAVENRRSLRLRSRFGPEYDRTLQLEGDQRRAERDLERRERRVERLHIEPLTRGERERFLAAWRADQARFVDDPAGAVAEADRLVQEVMRARRYPVVDFDQRAEDISVAHPHVVRNYRAAHQIALQHRSGEATTEDLRRALVYYRGLFDELLETEEVTR
jgi:hypothetical protein